MLENMMDLPGWIEGLLAAGLGSLATLAIQWLKRHLLPWESDRIRFEKIANEVDATAFEELANSIPTSISRHSSNAAYKLDDRLRQLSHEVFFDRRLRKQEAELVKSIEDLLSFQGSNFYVKQPHVDLYTMAFDNHDDWNAQHALLLDKKSDELHRLALQVLERWKPLNERGKKIFLGKTSKS